MPDQLILFVRPGCPDCQAARRFLAQRGVPFEERDVTAEAAAMRALTRVSGEGVVPTLVFGDDVQVGWDGDRARAMLDNPLPPRNPPFRVIIDENEEITF